MNNEKYSADIKTLRDRNARKNVLIGALMLTILLLAVVLTRVAGTARTVVVPPHVQRTFWVTDDRASAAYLEQMAGYMAWLILDVTPNSIEWKKQALLDFTAPDVTGAFQNRMDVESERLHRLNAATYFEIGQLIVNEDDQSVLIVGQFHTQINGLPTSAGTKQYLAKFEFKGGRVHLRDFKEVVNEAKK